MSVVTNRDARVARKMIGVSKPENMTIASGTQARMGIGRRVSRIGKE